jgi:hypothetical protein
LGDWKEETRADLDDAEARLASLAGSLSGEPTADQIGSIWRAYVSVEKSVAFIKVELESESPGVFVNKKVYRVPDERQAVVFALASLRRGAESFAAGDFETSLKQLRESRNYLRVLLIDKSRGGPGRRKAPGAR